MARQAPDTPSHAAFTVFYFLAVYKAPEVFRTILAAGASPNAFDREGIPLLHHAANSKRHSAVVALIEAGADVSLSDKKRRGRTAAHIAAGYGDTKILEALFAAGAMHSVKDDEDFEPLHWAILFGKSEAAVKLLLDRGTDIEVNYRQGMRPLAFATMSGSARMVHFLIHAGANVTARGECGETALHVAAAHGVPAAAHVLLSAGADATSVSYDGYTPEQLVGAARPRVIISEEDCEATKRVLLRFPAYRSRAWLWTVTGNSGDFSDGGGCGGGGPTLRALSASCLIPGNQKRSKGWRPTDSMLR